MARDHEPVGLLRPGSSVVHTDPRRTHHRARGNGFACFELPLLDIESGHQRGVGVDCLNVFDAGGDAEGSGLQIEAKTFFFLPQGLIVNHGCTSVRPVFSGVGDAGTTHITGSIPPGEFGGEPGEFQPDICQDAGGIILTTGGFKNFTGEVRLSGAVDLSSAGDGEITFSCLFLLDLDPGRHGSRGRRIAR